jgi:hypothetical protein
MQTQTALDARSARRRQLLKLGRRVLIILAWALLIALLIVGVAWGLGMKWERFTPLFTIVTLRFFLIGAVATIVVSLAAILLSLPLATLLALGRWGGWPAGPGCATRSPPLSSSCARCRCCS